MGSKMGMFDYQIIGNPDEGSTKACRAVRDSVRADKATIEGRLNTAIQLIEQVHEHMFGQPVHDCRKIKDALRILNDVRAGIE